MTENREMKTLSLTIKYLGLFLMTFNLYSCSGKGDKNPQTKVGQKPCDEILMPKVIDKKSVINLVRKFPELQECKITTDYSTFAIKGDFYGDGVDDLAVLLTQNDTVKICIINIGQSCGFHFLGTQGDELLGDSDYSWAGNFKTVKAGEVLWSNYEDDFRSIAEVPENEKVRLKYNSIYVHAVESCGGGFIFWKDGKFNWLQQE